MSTVDITKDIETIINHLLEEGKEPTTALIKARLSKSVPIPAIIAALRSWKSSKRVPKVEVAEQTSPTAEQRIASLENQISKLLARVANLEALIEKKI